MEAHDLTLLDTTDAIPSMPQIIVRLREVTRDNNYNQPDLLRLLSADPGIVADILKLANSALFGVLREVSSLTQAVVLLGIQRISNLVIGRCMTEWVNSAEVPLVETRSYWQRSLITGVLAARLAEQTHPKRREEAFMCGLLSDIGVIVLAQAYGTRYAPAAASYTTSHSDEFLAQELQLVGTTHALVAGFVLDRWMFPIEMINAISFHHTWPLEDLGDDQRLLTAALNTASDISWLLCTAPEGDLMRKTCASAIIKSGVPVDLLIDILNSSEADVAELAQVFRISVLPSDRYGTVTNALSMPAIAVNPNSAIGMPQPTDVRLNIRRGSSEKSPAAANSSAARNAPTTTAPTTPAPTSATPASASSAPSAR